MGVYRETFDIGLLSEADQLSYSINFYEEDKILEIVSMCCKLHYLKQARSTLHCVSFNCCMQLAMVRTSLPLPPPASLTSQKRTEWLLVPN